MILRVGLLLLILPPLALMTAYMVELSAVDSCLDGGGAWNYSASRCESSGDYSVIPYMQRHPLFVNGFMLLSVLGLLFCLVGLYRGRG
jgi:hypothetical protein